MSLCVVSIFLSVLCQNTPSTAMARARGRVVLQPPCSAAQPLCILSLRGQRVLFQSHCGQIYTHPSTLSSYLVLSLPVSFRHSCLPQCPNCPQRDSKVRFVLVLYFIFKRTQYFDKCQLLQGELQFSHLYQQTLKHPSCAIFT